MSVLLIKSLVCVVFRMELFKNDSISCQSHTFNIHEIENADEGQSIKTNAQNANVHND